MLLAGGVVCGVVCPGPAGAILSGPGVVLVLGRDASVWCEVNRLSAGVAYPGRYRLGTGVVLGRYWDDRPPERN